MFGLHQRRYLNTPQINYEITGGSGDFKGAAGAMTDVYVQSPGSITIKAWGVFYL